MMPYYSFPFEYSYRKGTNIPPQVMPMPVQEQLPEVELPEETTVPEEMPQPVQQQMPIPAPQPVQQPAQMPQPYTCPQMMQMCQPMLPCQQMMPQPIMPQQTMPMSPCPHMMQHMHEMDHMDHMGNMGSMDMSEAAYIPPYDYADERRPVISNNPPRTSITLFKEQTGYPNYGNPSGNADILYSRDRGEWTFNLPGQLTPGANQRAQLVIRVVLDDHYDVNANRYSANITINGVRVHTGRVPAEHGRPAGQRFTNWRELTFNIRSLRRNNRIVIENTSNAGPNDWIGFDWMEMRILSR